MNRNVIVVKMDGRLGNQLFRYATARALQESISPDSQLIFDFSAVYRSGSKQDGFEDSLRFFNCVHYDYCENYHDLMTIQQRTLELISKAVLKTSKNGGGRWFRYLNHVNARAGLYYCGRGTEYCPLIDTAHSVKSIVGRFEDERYFDAIREKLIKEIHPKEDLLTRNRSIANIIENSSSVCVTIRRGDYVTNPTNILCYNVCTKEYYIKGIEYISSQIVNPVFIFFSDDIEWCRKEFSFIKGAYFESGEDPIWEKVRLMKACKHFIISNSTFSWWMQYLSNNQDKIVVCPNKWFTDNVKGASSYPLINKDFILIEV